MRLDPQAVLQQISNLKLSHPDIWDDGDEKLLSDCLQGETDIEEFLAVVVDRMLDASHMAGAQATRIAELEQRQGRFEQREKVMRDLAFKVMSSADVRKLELSEATLSIVKGQRKLLGESDPNLLSTELVKIKREVNRAAVKAALETGQTVPGFLLSNSEPHLTVRTK